MAKKIILLLSKPQPSAVEQTYLCPDGSEVTGCQTNEAPVRYLLRAHPDTAEIICMVTPEAEITAWSGFRAMITAEAPDVALRPVAFREGQDFSGAPLREILSAVEKGDEILLETTGGFRNTVMDLLLLSRVLSYKGIATVAAVYSNNRTRLVEDVTHLIGLFELVGGMQELTRFGSVHTLRQYYAALTAEQQDEKIGNLLTAMERLTETITLCRTRQIPQRMEAFSQALSEAEGCEDPLMRTLLPVFRSKFGRKLSTPGLIKWCVESDMIQQALTIYKSRIPSYILNERKGDIMEVKPNAPMPNQRDYEDEAEARFFEHLLKMGQNMRKAYYGYDPDAGAGKWKDYTVTTMEHFEELMPISYFVAKCSLPQLRVIVMDYLYIRTLRNMINHANDRETDSQMQILDYLSGYGYKRLDEVNAEYIKQMIRASLEHLRLKN